ncbi:MAG: serine hydrolase [Litoreibacter sp.]|uniref:serine hydrolase domain-containing protein n=1 Tax=Litoreibacter sp. TaxID=1969459 RepID=UPI00329A7E8C
MRLFLKWALRLVVLLAVVAVVIGIWKREELTRLMAVNSLFSAEKIVDNFSNMNKAFLSTEIPLPDAAPSPLPKGPDATLPPQTQDWIDARDITALVALKNGTIVHESYHMGTGPDDRRISWSVAKSYLSALMGILLKEGDIASIDEPVTKYAPSLTGTAYDGATIRNVLNMSSGVTFNEDYLDQSSDINRMGRVLALGGTMDGFAESLSDTFAPAGETWKYVSIDTHVLSMVIRGATGRPISDLMGEKIIGPMGLETTPYYLTDGVGVAFVLGGLNMITRDYARMGQMFLQRGQLNGQQIVPADWVDASTKATAPTAPNAIGYGFQWWIPKGADEGEFMARGVYGQYIYINRTLGVVIATNAADRNFRNAGVGDENVAMFRAIAAAL